jgi:hypothetical protein
VSPDKWDIETTIAFCVQEEDRLKASNGGSINYVKDNKKGTLLKVTKVPLQSHMEKLPFIISIRNGNFQWTKIHVSTARSQCTTRKIALIG